MALQRASITLIADGCTALLKGDQPFSLLQRCISEAVLSKLSLATNDSCEAVQGRGGRWRKLSFSLHLFWPLLKPNIPWKAGSKFDLPLFCKLIHNCHYAAGATWSYQKNSLQTVPIPIQTELVTFREAGNLKWELSSPRMELTGMCAPATFTPVLVS